MVHSETGSFTCYILHVICHDYRLILDFETNCTKYDYTDNMAMQFNKPRFDWEVKDCLSELEQFKQECSVLFQGPLSEMKDAQKAGLIVNWIGRQCIMTLHSMNVVLDKPRTVFENLERIFRPESNQTLSRFKF